MISTYFRSYSSFGVESLAYVNMFGGGKRASSVPMVNTRDNTSLS
ncbi:hypothetical protein [secondary endosymbiont of Heteropsylla cubana]|nr:hypothetical protein [secondary endosymbiont of Heteropsylla cubana]